MASNINIVDECKEDLADLRNLLNIATRQKIKNLLNIEIRKLETTISEAQASIPAPHTDSPTIECSDSGRVEINSPTTTNQQPKRYEVELTNYAWDQSEKFVKIFVTLDGVQALDKDDVAVNFTDRNLCLRISGLNNKNYKLIINNLLDTIDTEKSYHKVKTNMIVIYAKKIKEAKSWSHLTSVEKRIQDNKPDKFGGDTDAKDPTAGLFNMMKNLYQSGDSEMKRMISKAWVEGEEKRKSAQPDPMDF